jgi:phosphate transport system substrate-binding protein
MKSIENSSSKYILDKGVDVKASVLFILFVYIASLLAGCAVGANGNNQYNGHLTISGSTALEPLVEVAAQMFMQQHPEAHIEVVGGGSTTGVQNVTQGKSNIGDSDIYADPALYPDPDLTDHIICVTPFILIVNPDVTVNDLTNQQVIDIFSTGKITNWDQIVGGNNQTIHPIVRPATSGTRATFREYVLEGGDEKGTNLNVDDTQAVVNKVASTPGAIGYVALSALTSTVKEIGIDNQHPTPDTIGNGSYNFWSYEHMYTMGDDSPLLDAFLNFMTSSAVQQKASQLRYIPINEMKTPTLGFLPGEQLFHASFALSPVAKSEVTYSES